MAKRGKKMSILTFKGGVHPYDGKELSKDVAVRKILPEGELVFPVSQHIGAPAKPVVEVGERVLKGQLIAGADGFVSANIHSSVSGTVKKIEKRLVPNGSKVLSIIIENDNLYEEYNYGPNNEPWSKDTIRKAVKDCGVVGLGGAKEESINMILEFAQAKEEGNLEKLYVMGCLSERYLKELAVEIPQVDKFYGKFNWRELLQDLGKAYHDELHIERTLTTPKHYAYLKISEGCDRKCSYCAIPIITGRHVSRPMEEILDEVKYLVARGVKEFQVIAQELTYYGVDLYKKQMLPELVERISDIPGVEWIRLHYAYPAHFPTDLFRVMRERDNVCKYMDIALQHISDNMLQKMRRHVTKDETYKLIEQFREEVPGIHLRTTLMVGHPGETEADFEELKEFVRKVRFDRMGAFAYSEEEGTYAAAEYEDSIPQEVKQARLDELMSIQQGISGELSAEKVGRQMKVIIDRLEGEYYIGRTEFDSPEVDPEVLIERGDRALHIGNFYHVEIVNSDDFDLFGRII